MTVSILVNILTVLQTYRLFHIYFNNKLNSHFDFVYNKTALSYNNCIRWCYTLSLRKDIRDIFRKNLRFYRLKNKLTQEELSEKADLTDKYISDLERGEYSPSLEKMDMLAEALNIETYKLLKDENDVDNLPNRLDEITGTRRTKKKY